MGFFLVEMGKNQHGYEVLLYIVGVVFSVLILSLATISYYSVKMYRKNLKEEL